MLAERLRQKLAGFVIHFELIGILILMHVLYCNYYYNYSGFMYGLYICMERLLPWFVLPKCNIIDLSWCATSETLLNKLVPALGFQVALQKFGDYDYYCELPVFGPLLHVFRQRLNTTNRGVARKLFRGGVGICSYFPRV